MLLACQGILKVYLLFLWSTILVITQTHGPPWSLDNPTLLTGNIRSPTNKTTRTIALCLNFPIETITSFNICAASISWRWCLTLSKHLSKTVRLKLRLEFRLKLSMEVWKFHKLSCAPKQFNQLHIQVRSQVKHCLFVLYGGRGVFVTGWKTNKLKPSESHWLRSCSNELRIANGWFKEFMTEKHMTCPWRNLLRSSHDPYWPSGVIFFPQQPSGIHENVLECAETDWHYVLMLTDKTIFLV